MPDQPTRRNLLGGLPIVVVLLAAIAAAGYGAHLLISGTARTIGIFLIGLGLVFVPVWIVSLIGAIVCIGAGGYSFYLYGVGFQGIVFVIVGLITLADNAQALALRRELEAKRGD